MGEDEKEGEDRYHDLFLFHACIPGDASRKRTPAVLA